MEPYKGLPPPEKPPYESPFNYEIRDPEGLYSLFRSLRKDRPTMKTRVGNETSFSQESSFDLRDITIDVSKFYDRYSVKELDQELMGKISDKLQAHVSDSLQVTTDGKIVRQASKGLFLQDYQGQIPTEAQQMFSHILMEGNGSTEATFEEFNRKLRDGCEVFRIVLSELCRYNNIPIPDDTLVIAPPKSNFLDPENRINTENLNKLILLNEIPKFEKLQKLQNNFNTYKDFTKPRLPTEEEIREKFSLSDDEHARVKIIRDAIRVGEGKQSEQERSTFDEIGGQDDAVEEARTLADQLSHPETYEQWGVKPPRGILFYGPPGTGKTLIARALAQEANAAFVIVNATDIASKWYGEAESQMKGIFAMARQAAKSHPSGHAILFIDEVDSFFPTRQSNLHEATRRVIGVGLQEIDGLKNEGGITVVAATNDPENVDRAFLSRMEAQLEVGLPRADGIKKILEIHLAKKSELAGRSLVQDDLDLSGVAAEIEGVSGRDIADLIESLLRSKARKQRQGDTVSLVTADDIKEAIAASSKIQSIIRARKGNTSMGFGGDY